VGATFGGRWKSAESDGLEVVDVVGSRACGIWPALAFSTAGVHLGAKFALFGAIC